MWTATLISIFSTFTLNWHNGNSPILLWTKWLIPADLPSWQSLQEIFYHSSLFYATQRFWPHNCIWYKNDSTCRRSIHLQNINQEIKHKKHYHLQFNKKGGIKNHDQWTVARKYPDSTIESNSNLKRQFFPKGLQNWTCWRT